MESTYELPYDDKSHTMLESAIAALGGGKDARLIIGKVYALGRIDGHTEQVNLTRASFEKALAQQESRPKGGITVAEVAAPPAARA